jgi:hypothetical protein
MTDEELAAMHRLFKSRISAQQSCHFTRAGYSCGLQGSRGFITAVNTRHQ